MSEIHIQATDTTAPAVAAGGIIPLLNDLLPRALNPYSTDDTATVFHAILTRAHLDRHTARMAGWRGIRPSFSHGTAWTGRIAARDYIYGVTFDSQELYDGRLLLGYFSLYAFPDPDEAHLLIRTERQQAEIASAQWPVKIRNLSENADALKDYKVADLELGLSMDRQGLEVSLTADRSVPVVDASGEHRGYLRPLNTALPFFATLATSLEAMVKQVDAGVPCENVLWAEPSKDNTTVSVTQTFACGSFAGTLPGRRMRSLPYRHRPHVDELKRTPVVHVLSGFLGSGKTTFLRQWLEYLNGRERFTGVIQNEFGQADLDSLVLQGQTRVEAIDEGCVCCTLADGLRPCIERLNKATPSDQFIVETTGLARASRVMDELLVLNDMVTRGLLITVVDSYDCIHHPEVLDFDRSGPDSACRQDQIEHADVLVCAKAETVDPQALESLQATLHQLNPKALIIPANNGNAPFAVLDAFYLECLDIRHGHLPSRDVAHHQTDGLFSCLDGLKSGADHGADESQFMQFALAVPEAKTTAQWQALLQSAGQGLVRAKGLVMHREYGAVLLQYAGGVLDFQSVDDVEGMSGRGQSPADRFVVFIGTDLVEPTGYRHYES